MIDTNDKWPDDRYIGSNPSAARVAELDVSIETAKTDLAKLEARENALEAELAGVRKRMERLKIYVEVSEEYSGGSSAKLEQVSLPHLNGTNHSAAAETTLPSLEDEPLIEACRGKSIADAAIALIRLAAHPLSEEEIVDQFRRGKMTIVSKNPALNLHFALLRKRRDTGAVKLTKDKKHWDLGDPNLENDTLKRSAFFQNRQRNDHAERSRQGLLAARERGARHGRQSTYTDEQIHEAIAAREAGATWKAAAEPIGISVTRLQARIRELQGKEEQDFELQTPGQHLVDDPR